MLTVILAAMYFAALLLAHIIDPATAILVLSFAAGGFGAVYLWLNEGRDAE